ncbi:hypothetical protein ACL6C3_29965 [Capilliphycus salinus ALCB114379]|uniref:hypothetical protein n=1 Tax=Capilliphycus salinus TaxID=2768948 RepID=UPI0039A54F1F
MMILTFLVRGYVLIGVIFFAHCLRKFFQDQSTPKTNKSSWIVLGAAALLWPIVIPLSHLERRAKPKIKSDPGDIVQYRMTAPPLVERENSDQKISLTSTPPCESPSCSKNKDTTNIA